jgi:predicted ATPase with chaperone activity
MMSGSTTGNLRVVLVAGEPGIGKTLLPERAFELEPDMPELRFRAAAILLMAGQIPEALAIQPNLDKEETPSL